MSNNYFNTEKYLGKVEIDTIRQMQAVLMRDNRNASNKLYNSFEMRYDKTDNGFFITMDYASHGKYVLDSRRRIRAAGPSRQAINSLMQWILDKKISVGNGQVRTPMTKRDDRGGEYDLEPKHTSYNKEKEVKSFAFAIWYNTKKRQSIATPSTNFLKPYENLMKNRTFKDGLVEALAKDGIGMFNEQIKGSMDILKIKI